jgi:predicted metalloprotease
MPVRGVAAGGGGLLLLIIIIVSVLTGRDPTPLLQQAGQQAQQQSQTQQPVDPAQEPLRQFVAVVLADTEDVWESLLPKSLSRPYEQPKLVLFTSQVESACGFASAATGPFYCPGDHKVYLDLGFFDEMKRKFGAPGDFALSVRLELQADYLAGCWAHHAQKAKDILESGDVEEALNAANAIGDDTLQKQAQGYVVPDSFTHGSSAQRVRWFKRGLESGDVKGMMVLFELPFERL